MSIFNPGGMFNPVNHVVQNVLPGKKTKIVAVLGGAWNLLLAAQAAGVIAPLVPAALAANPLVSLALFALAYYARSVSKVK